MFSDAPRHLPPFSVLVEHLERPASVLVDHLEVSRRTVQRWSVTDCAPRSVLLAIFWETRYGRSAVECRAVNDARHQAGLARCHLDTANARLRDLAHVLALADFGSANSPLLAHGAPCPAHALVSPTRARSAGILESRNDASK